ncbi:MULTISPECIES: hypothetical protein [Cohnella]|uniref:hypothetical protein n=1 Tax=Cohnella TaxID=329857 RepID=UPI0009BBD448|nr:MULTISPECIES: hypothetical protein [Cohnella]MBN2982176.1 GNAT family N-acetyltransferase [Cohnella algarum]
MKINFKVCRDAQDLAQFSQYFIRNRADFSGNFNLGEALLYILRTVPNSQVVLARGHDGQTIGWTYYRYLTADGEPHPQGEVAFVDSAIISEGYRKSGAFVTGFRFLVNHIVSENENVRTFRFHALADRPYLNRLYGKFADVIGQADSLLGVVNVYSSDAERMSAFFNRLR